MTTTHMRGVADDPDEEDALGDDGRARVSKVHRSRPPDDVCARVISVIPLVEQTVLTLHDRPVRCTMSGK
jgi:hypothetical protein